MSSAISTSSIARNARSARVSCSAVVRGGGACPSGCHSAASAPRDEALRAPGVPGSIAVARWTSAAPAESPENRNSGPRIALFQSGRATIVLSRIPV